MVNECNDDEFICWSGAKLTDADCQQLKQHRCEYRRIKMDQRTSEKIN